jgi:hypothetical protein
MTTKTKENKGEKKTKWVCEECGAEFKTKKALIEHLIDEFEEATQTADSVADQLESLGIENPYA